MIKNVRGLRGPEPSDAVQLTFDRNDDLSNGPTWPGHNIHSLKDDASFVIPRVLDGGIQPRGCEAVGWSLDPPR